MQEIIKKILKKFAKQKVQQREIMTPEERIEKLAEIRRLAELPFPTDRELKRVDIICLTYKDPEVEVVCAKNIIEYTKWPYKITIFDNRPGTKNLAKVWNKLMRESTCDYVLLINSDAFVPKLEDPCWLTRMMEVFEKKQDSWVVLPKVDRTSCLQQRTETPYDGEPEVLIEPFAAMCVLFRKDIFEKIGYLDEDFLFHGQDTEWAMRLLHSPYPAYIVPDVLVRHVGHYSNKKIIAAGEYDKEAESEYTKFLYEEKTKKYKTTSLPR